jgi:ATP-binding cassette subfamily B protein
MSKKQPRKDIQEVKQQDPFKDLNHQEVLLNKSEIKHRNEITKDYSKDINKMVQGGGRHRVYLGKEATDRKQTFRRLWDYLGNYKFGLITVFISLLLASLAAVVLPLIFGNALDSIKDSEFLKAYQFGAYIIILATIYAFITFVGKYTMEIISQNTVAKIRKDAFDKLQTLPVKYYDENQAGDIVSRLTNDVDLISNILANFVTQLVTSVITLVGSLAMMFYLNWVIALVVLIFVPLMAIFTKKISKKTRKGFTAQQKHLGNLNGIIEENISGLRVVKLYGQEENTQSEFHETNMKLRDEGYKAQVYAGFIMPVIGFINNLIYVVIVIIGAFFFITEVQEGSFGAGLFLITVGGITALTQYARQFVQPISNLGQLFNTLQQGLAGAERVFHLIDEESEYEEDGEEVVEAFKGKVEFKHVNFEYTEGQKVLKDISFTAQEGEVVAIVGPTGSGKTTIINLMNRFYDVNEGEILIDNKNIKTYKKDHLRKNLGIVLQDTKLFAGTVFENIIYGDLNASNEDVTKASQLANAHDFIMKLPQGYESEVMEEGKNFSQGERQLISIARTMLSNPDILILDEATSNVDTRTEFKVQESMHTLMKSRTSFIIAHRLQTIRNANKILVIKDGTLIENGNHSELLHLKGFYYDLYTTQFKDLVLEES